MASSSSGWNAARPVKKVEGLDPLRFPHIIEIVRSMAEQDEIFVYRLPIRRFSTIFFMRMQILGQLMLLRRKLCLLDETLFLAVYLFDQHIIACAKELRPLDEMSPRQREKYIADEFRDIKEFSALQKSALSALFLAAKFQEISPPKLADIIGDILSPKEFCVLEASLLQRIGFRLLPSSYISYIHVITQKALRYPPWATKMRRLILIALIGNYLSHGKPLHVILGLALLFVYNDFPDLLSALRKCFLDFGVDESCCVDACTRLSFDFKDFYVCFQDYNVERFIKPLIDDDDLFEEKTASHC